MQEILAELPKLKPEELELIKARLATLLSGSRGSSEVGTANAPLSGFLVSMAGAGGNELPQDLAAEHDHYLYGSSKRCCT